VIRLQDLHQTYSSAHGPVHALRGIDLEVAPGEVFGVIGRSGAGKSSLVRTINLLNRPTQGQVWLDGQDLTTLDDAALRQARRGIGMIFQHFNLLSSRTVFDNVALPLELAGMQSGDIHRRVAPLLELVGLAELRHRYPAQISGGQKQRVGIARALASRPKVLLSDEATSALDPETTRGVLALLQQISREFALTVVLVTHQMQAIKQATGRLAVIDAGRIVEQGTVLDVFTRPQHTTTRSLLDDVLPQQLPASVLARLRLLMADAPVPAARVLRLAFAGVQADRPLLSEVVRRFSLDLNIVHGQVDEIQGEPFGTLAVVLRGRADQLDAAETHLRAAGVAVQVLLHSAGATRAGAEVLNVH
jgi:D-methionine transport system ATP-binding protein